MEGTREGPQASYARPEVYLREMRLGDLDQVLQIETRSFPTPWSRKAFVSELTRNRYAYYIIAQMDDRVVGYGGMWVIGDEAHITNIAVDPECRRRGIGKRLLQELLDRARDFGARSVTLEVRRSNVAAQRLYEGQGFEARGVRKGYYTDTGDDAIVMVKTLGGDDQRQGIGRWPFTLWE